MSWIYNANVLIIIITIIFIQYIFMCSDDTIYCKQRGICDDDCDTGDDSTVSDVVTVSDVNLEPLS